MSQLMSEDEFNTFFSKMVKGHIHFMKTGKPPLIPNWLVMENYGSIIPCAIDVYKPEEPLFAMSALILKSKPRAYVTFTEHFTNFPDHRDKPQLAKYPTGRAEVLVCMAKTNDGKIKGAIYQIKREEDLNDNTKVKEVTLIDDDPQLSSWKLP